MAKEYIEKEAIIKRIDCWRKYNAEVKNYFMSDELNELVHGYFADIINSLPTADVVEVVRCKECNEYNGHRYRNYHADPVDDNDYCSYGERKE